MHIDHLESQFNGDEHRKKGIRNTNETQFVNLNYDESTKTNDKDFIFNFESIENQFVTKFRILFDSLLRIFVMGDKIVKLQQQKQQTKR